MIDAVTILLVSGALVFVIIRVVSRSKQEVSGKGRDGQR